MLCVPHHYHSMDFALKLHFFVFVVVDIPFGKTSLSLAVLKQDESDLSSLLYTIEDLNSEN